MNDLPLIPFLTADRAAQFWQYIEAILYVVMPILLIYVATTLAGNLLSVLRNVFSKIRGSDDEKRYENIKFKD